MDAGDLTARARIRDAALMRFAEQGVKGATIRGIAEAAGVSPGLVQHHFGSKDTLREACDAYAIEAVRRIKREAINKGGIAEPGYLSVFLRTALPIQRYLARAMVDGSPAAAALYDEMVEFSEEYLAEVPPGVNVPETEDLHAYAAVITTMSLGLIVLHEHLARALGADPLTPEGYPRMGRAMVEIFNDNLLSPELVEQSRTAMRALFAQQEAQREAQQEAQRETEQENGKENS